MVTPGCVLSNVLMSGANGFDSDAAAKIVRVSSAALAELRAESVDDPPDAHPMRLIAATTEIAAPIIQRCCIIFMPFYLFSFEDPKVSSPRVRRLDAQSALSVPIFCCENVTWCPPAPGVVEGTLVDMSVRLGMPHVRATVPAAAADPAHPMGAARPTSTAATGLIDQYGRTATDLRVSVTDRCNLRCTYCMPAEGMPWLQKTSLMTRDEIVHLVRLAIRDLGIRKVRFTGGEPLLRPDLVDIVREVRCAADVELALTTNGVALDRWAGPLADAGLQRVNISLDTIDDAEFAQRTRRPWLHRVLDGIAAAQAAGLKIKANAVLQWDEARTGEGWSRLVRYLANRGIPLRFIEEMPIGRDDEWALASMARAEDLFTALAKEWTISPSTAARNGAPAESFILRPRTSRDAKGLRDEHFELGVIASVTRPFCADCRRTRLTADGCVRSCLFSRSETDLLAALRAGADDAVIAELWRGTMWEKQSGHMITAPEFERPDRSMSAIGG